jgi:hypothetical protein
MADSTDDDDLRARVAELEQRVENQQATISKLLPGRRGVLKAGGLLAGGGVLGALTADRAAADVVGQVGTDADRVDVFAGAVDANSVSTRDLSNDYYYAGGFDGTDPDARLDAALSAADSGGRIYLENDVYTVDRTIDSGRYYITGTNGFPTTTTRIDANWTFDNRASLEYIRLGGSLNLNTFNGYLSNISGGSITVNDGANVLQVLRGCDVTFASGTSSNILDIAINTSITDNGTNEIGLTA